MTWWLGQYYPPSDQENYENKKQMAQLQRLQAAKEDNTGLVLMLVMNGR